MKQQAKALAKRIVGWVASEYRINWIYASDRASYLDNEESIVERETAAHRATLLASSTDKIRSSQSYAKAGLAGLVLMQNGNPVSVAHFAEVNQYRRSSTWPLRHGEVCLMDIATERARARSGFGSATDHCSDPALSGAGPHAADCIHLVDQHAVVARVREGRVEAYRIQRGTAVRHALVEGKDPVALI